MKPCKSCPFRPDALSGLWHPAHYLAIAYLGSADVPGLITTSMGCHQWNGVVSDARQPEDTPLCGGWIRAANGTINMRLKMLSGRADPDEVFDDEPRLSVEEMARVNGLDMDRLPPLRWDQTTAERYADPEEWMSAVLALRQACLDDPDIAFGYVVPGSPLANGVDRDEVAAVMGDEVAARYFDDGGPLAFNAEARP